MQLTRGHWGIENGLHGVRDGTLREDASRIRRGSATQVMAIVRNIVILVFNQRGYRSAAAATRHYVCQPPRDTGNPVKTNLRMKRPWAASLLRLTVCRQTFRVPAKPSQNLRQTTARNHGLGRRHVMIAQECGRRTLGWLLGISIAGILATGPAQAQQQRRSLFGGTQTAAPKADDNPAADTPQSIRLDQINVPGVKVTAIPVNPTDPIAIVNNQVITRQQLADECVARRGKEILETLINRVLIEQALKSAKQEITAAEIDQEIENVARRFGIGREAWLRTLDKERGISPVQYARDIIYPALALRKLCAGRVSVTPKDLQEAFDSQYGDKLRCRMIMVDKLAKAQDIWERLKKNPGGFEKIAQDESMDAGSRSLGGQLAEPITRHAYPRNVADAAFRQLVDGDPDDKDPTHKPKTGDFTGPIQAAESVWVILRRDAIIPATPGASLKDERVKKQTYEMIYEVKLKEMMGVVFQELVKMSAIENKLVGSVKLANEEQQDDYNSVDKSKVKLMSNAGGGDSTVDDRVGRAAASGSAGAGSKAKLPPPVAASPEAIQQFENMQKRPLRTSQDAAGASPAPSTAPPQ